MIFALVTKLPPAAGGSGADFGITMLALIVVICTIVTGLAHLRDLDEQRLDAELDRLGALARDRRHLEVVEDIRSGMDDAQQVAP